ncbi:hypothetical protein AB431_20810 [Mycobacterium sp. EPa45]|nr:hypothetical protein AB431_20810 [Mycobacterium sp. EPa45]
MRDSTNRNSGYPRNYWLLCIACGEAFVINGFDVVPNKMPFSEPGGTPERELALWREVRKCFSVNAYNAVAMLCRKILLHMVFTHQRSKDGDATPRDLSFAAAVRYLADNGVITEDQRTLAEGIKNVGNKANHELPDITKEEAGDIALFTYFLFLSAYEMPSRARYQSKFVGDAAVPFEGNLGPDAESDLAPNAADGE